MKPHGLVISAVMSLSACTVGPGFSAPPVNTSGYDTQATPRVALEQPVAVDWWSTFHSQKLDGVVRQALAGNLELTAADATLRQATAFMEASQGALWPQVSFAAQAGRQRVRNGPQPSVHNVYEVGPQVSFDLDVFGANQRRVEQQAAFADLQRHRYEAAYLSLTGNVARQALLMASASAQMEAVQRVLATDARNLELVRVAQRSGATTELDVSLARTRLEQDRTLLPPLAQQRDVARHALAILTGQGPADWRAPDFNLDDFALPGVLPLSLPSTLAHDRPDVLQAEAQLHAASAAVGIATANLYPRVELSASLMQAASGNGGALLWGLAGGLTAPVFNGGTLKAERRAAEQGYNASLADYRQTVIAAFGQVADILQSINHHAEQYQAQAAALQAADTSLRLNQHAFASGENGVLQVLEAQRAYQQALLGQIQTRTAQHLDTVQLFVALGGRSVNDFTR